MLLNLPRAIAWLEQFQLDAVVAASWQNVFYLSDYYLWLQPVFKEYMAAPGGSSDPMPLFALLTCQGTLTLVLDQMCELNATESWAAKRFVYGIPTSQIAVVDDDVARARASERSPHRFETALDALVAAIRAEHLDDARIGVEIEAIAASRLAQFRSAMPRAELLDATNWFRLVRMVKSEEELERLRRAAEINEQAATKSLALAAPSHPMQQVVQAFRASAAAQGADFDHFAFSEQGVGFTTETEYCLPERETMFVDFGCVFQHYYSDAGVTLVIGAPTAREQAAYQTLVECLNETADRLRPGIRASAVQALMQGLFERRGIAGQFPHGHGIGIELRDYPILAPDAGRRIRDDCVDVSADLPLEEGMVINLEAPIFGLGDAALQLEQSYVVTATGGRPLTNRDLTRPIQR